MKLSIIIPAYNAEPFIDQLIERLYRQLTKEVEVIVIDDGSRFPYLPPYPEIKVIRQEENKGVSAARNAGLDAARGEWVAFIDADDLVSEHYVEKVLEVLSTEPDFVYLSWETFGKGWKAKVTIQSKEQKFPAWNQCVWNRIYKRSVIGETRFNEKKAIAEDAEFIRAVREEGRKKAFIPETVYFYRTDPRNSLTERFNRGELDMERIVYHYPSLKDVNVDGMIKEIREEIKTAEVIVMTNDQCEKLEKVCMVMEPAPINATEWRGYYTKMINVIPKPIKAQVVIYQGRIHEIGGVETWIFNFTKIFKDQYDILVLYGQQSSEAQLDRLREMVPVVMNGTRRIVCDTFLNMRITDKIPANVTAKQVIQLCHLCQAKENYKIQPQHDLVVFPSKAAKKSFADQTDGMVIQNPTIEHWNEARALILVTASRFTYEKGYERMKALAARLKEKKVEFAWFVFTDANVKPFPGMIKMEPTLDIIPWIKSADYLVQLSDQESFCYSIVEAMECGTGVITTNLPVLLEIGFMEGDDGWILPWEGKISDETIERICNCIPKIPKSRMIQNERIKADWKSLLGNTKKQWKDHEGQLTIKITCAYYDQELSRMVKEGEELTEPAARADYLIRCGVAKLANNAKIDMI